MRLPQDLTLPAMFRHANGVVRAVMIGLISASVVTWTILLAKGVDVALAKARLRRALTEAEADSTLAELQLRLGQRRDPLAMMIRAVTNEIRLSGTAPAAGIKERVASRLDRTEATLGRQLMRATGLLATIGSTAPFIGLFGTVWGIMDSFIGISQAQTTSLAVVAPGIAEALLATAAGLVAAIPAVVIYNGFARAIGGYRAMLADLAASVQRLVSRELDRRTHRAQGSGGVAAMAVRLDHGDDEMEESHEINVTPFIDVILVLLIIFMVAAPLATVDVPVELPSSTAAAQPRPDKPIFLTLRADKTLALGDAPVAAENLGPALDQASGSDRTQRIFLRADKTIPYGDLMGTMDALRGAGYLKLALVTLDTAPSP